jgi:hypothetical protein
MKRIFGFLALLCTLSCHTPTQKWLDGMTEFGESKSPGVLIRAIKIKPESGDSTELTYKIRVYPSNAENAKSALTEHFYYHADSLFYFRCGKAVVTPRSVQPIANGLTDCFEYLVSVEITSAIKLHKLSLVFHDQMVDDRDHIIQLNK